MAPAVSTARESIHDEHHRRHRELSCSAAARVAAGGTVAAAHAGTHLQRGHDGAC